MNACVSLVGAGPGDPSLLTMAAVREIRAADVVLYDALVHPSVLSHARSDAEIVFVGKRVGHDGIKQSEINTLLVTYAKAGKRVCRLKGGDPFVFGRGSEEAEALTEAGIAFRVVPGVTAAVGVTAYAGIPLTHRNLSSSVALVTSTEHANKTESSHRWDLLATATQTLVIYMGARKIREEMQRLVEHGRPLDTPVAVIHWGTRSTQVTVHGTLVDIADRCEARGIGSPALVVVGQVAAQHDRFSWWERSPLHGKQIVLTRSLEHSHELAERLLAAGAEPLLHPAIRVAPLLDQPALDTALRSLRSYDAVVWTSANGVAFSLARLRALGLDARAFANTRLVAVGPATAARLDDAGLIADLVPPEDFRAETLSQLMLTELRPRRVLLLRAQRARAVLPVALRAAGVEVDDVAVYTTTSTPPDQLVALRESLEQGQVDAVTFFSGSAVQAFVESWGDATATLLSPVWVVAVGPVTREALERHGIRVDAQAAQSTSDAVFETLEQHYSVQEDS